MRPPGTSDEREVRELLAAAERPVVVPPFSDVRRRSTRTSLVPIALAVVVTVVAAVGIGGALRDLRAEQRPPSGAIASASPTPSTSAGFVVHESPIFGYRISLPEAYRRLKPAIVINSQVALLGTDPYTLLSEREEREECLKDVGDIPPASAASLFYVETYRNPASLSAADWATTPSAPGAPPRSIGSTVVPLTTIGQDAVRLVADSAGAETLAVVIRADDRIYVLTAAMWPSPHRLEEIAATFSTIARQPFPTPTPSAPPSVRRQAASALADSLAQAFAARDTDAVARVMPECHISVTPLIEGQGLANSGGGGLNRSVPAFVQALRDRFAAGDLTVTVDPTLQSDGNFFYVRSEWKESDRTTRIDLLLNERDGRWLWVAARHHYQRADLGNRNCIPYRSPWVAGMGC